MLVAGAGVLSKVGPKGVQEVVERTRGAAGSQGQLKTLSLKNSLRNSRPVTPLSHQQMSVLGPALTTGEPL